MTIAIALKVGDCVVLGADSASSLMDGRGELLNVYFNAEKIVDLRKDLRIGMVTYGLGGIAGRSITTHAKDLRRKLGQAGDPLAIDKDSYTVEEVSERVQRYFIDQLYRAEWPRVTKDSAGDDVRNYASMGFLVAGYSANASEGEVWRVEVDSAGLVARQPVFKVGESGVDIKGQPEAVYRLAFGWSPRILEGLVASGIPAADAEQFLLAQGAAQLVQPSMPLQDAVDLVNYLCEVTAGFVRFIPGGPTVHPPIDIATINFHEGFRWVQRKHYFSPALNSPIVCG